MRSATFRFALTLAAAALAGCAVPTPPTAEAIHTAAMPQLPPPPGWAGKSAAPGAVADNWLAGFGDAQLDALVREALLYNADLGVAAVRVEQAAAYAKLAGSAIYPAVNLLAHGGDKSGGDGSGTTVAGLFASWELDLWGRVRSERAAGEQQYAATLADTEFARQSIAALVAKSWLLAIEARLQRAIADNIVRASEQAVALAQDRLRVGRGDDYDVTLAQANLESARDAARQIGLAYEQALRALETLVGRYPAAAIELAAALPSLPGAVPTGLPSDLLERRPDVIAAERRVAAAFYRVSEAKAARLPRLSLTANVTGVSSSSIFVLQSDRQNPVYGLGLNLTAPIFNGYALEAQVEIKTAEQKLAVAEYGRIAQRAFGEVEGALAASLAADERAAILARSVASNARALELAQARYKVGVGDMRAVVQQNIALYAGRTAELRMRSERLIQRVNLHLSLGGGFEPRAGDTVQSGIDDAALRFVSTRTAPKN